MRAQRRWSFVPRSAGGCVAFLLLGIALVALNIVRMVAAGEAAILPLVAAVLGVVTVGVAVAGLVSPRLRSR